LNFCELIGIGPERHFNQVKYTGDDLVDGRKPDYRNTLYWNPSLSTDEKGNAGVTFYTSDEKGKYLITIDGISQDGKTLTKQLVLEVE
jgi:hypothetical protein